MSEKKIRLLKSATGLPDKWDALADSLYQKKSFLAHSEKYQFSKQKYYLLFSEDELIGGAIVFSYKVNLLTFIGGRYFVNMRIIAVPVSVDSSGLIGDCKFYPEILNYIFKKEKGLILALNYKEKIELKNIAETKTLPGCILKDCPESYEQYIKMMRHPYRRRVKLAQKKGAEIVFKTESCNAFTGEHYRLYLEIIKKTDTKLEVLSKNFFVHLNTNFRLSSAYFKNKLVAWNITVKDSETLYFLFGGIDYKYRDKFDSYYNNLLHIIKGGIVQGCSNINLGQTAEISKNRLGAEFYEKKMFLYHKNLIVRSILKLLKHSIGFNKILPNASVFKKNIL